MNVMLLKASRFLICPQPLVVIGVSPKSYGYFLQVDRESEGVKFLGLPEASPESRMKGRTLLPGTNINTCWLLAMEAIVDRYGGEFGDGPNYARYRQLQVLHVLREHYVRRTLGSDVVGDLWKNLSSAHRVTYGMARGIILFLTAPMPNSLRRRILGRIARFLSCRLGQVPDWDPSPVDGQFATVVDVFERFAISDASNAGG
jgi:hypothetical protein